MARAHNGGVWSSLFSATLNMLKYLNIAILDLSQEDSELQAEIRGFLLEEVFHRKSSTPLDVK
jgi:hypothetical protein